MVTMIYMRNKQMRAALIALFATGLVLTGFGPATTAHDSPGKPVNEHVLSQSLPDIGPGVQAIICSEVVAGAIGIPGSGPKGPGEERCDENNPNWLLGVNTGAVLASNVYYDLLRIRMVGPDGFTDPVGVGQDPKLDLQVGTGISQNVMLGVGNPNTWNVAPGDLRWYLTSCHWTHASFIQDTSPITLPIANALAIQCPVFMKNDGWGAVFPATDYLVNSNMNSVSTGFLRPNIEDIVDGNDGTSFIVSVVEVDEAHEISPTGSVTHTEFRRSGGNSYLDTHDWFLALSPEDPLEWGAAIEKHLTVGLHNNSGSDSQAGKRNPLR